MREQIIDPQSHRRSHTGDRPGIARIHGPLDLHHPRRRRASSAISTAWSCFKKRVTVVFGASGPLFDSQFGQGRLWLIRATPWPATVVKSSGAGVATTPWSTCTRSGAGWMPCAQAFPLDGW